MNRRDFARNVVGAMVGTSAIPAFGSKPVSKVIAGIDPALEGGDYCIMVKGFWHHDGKIEWNNQVRIPIPHFDISVAQKVHLKEMWG
jgi:hypothetical protein